MGLGWPGMVLAGGMREYCVCAASYVKEFVRDSSGAEGGVSRHLFGIMNVCFLLLS